MYSKLSDQNRNMFGVHSLPEAGDVQTLEDLAALYIERTNLAADSEPIVAGRSFLCLP
jgi:hypothetical protein